MSKVRMWVVDVLVGGIGGGIVGAIAAVNLVIFSGMSRGYETTIPQVFDENFVVGSVVVALLVSGPLVGLWVMRRRRGRQSHPELAGTISQGV